MIILGDFVLKVRGEWWVVYDGETGKYYGMVYMLKNEKAGCKARFFVC